MSRRRTGPTVHSVSGGAAVCKRAFAHWHPTLGDLYEYATYDAMGLDCAG
jgi:hypothetical protein